MHYSFSVWDSSANVLSQLAISNLFIAGNSLDTTADHSVSLVRVTDDFNLAGAQNFWTTINPTFLSVGSTTAAKTFYSINDSIDKYITDETTGSAVTSWVLDADVKTVTGTAQEIYQAQQDQRLIFPKLGSSDHIIATGSAGQQTLQGSAGSDTLDGGADNDTIYGNAGDDTITGGTGYNYLSGGSGADTIYAGAVAANTAAGNINSDFSNTVIGGAGGDKLLGSDNRDIFIYEGSNREALIAESGTSANTRDYITNFSVGDTISFVNAGAIKFLGTGSGNASSVAAGEFGLSIRYDKNQNIQDWNGSNTVVGTKVSIDIADANGRFDNVPEVNIILVGVDLDINVVGNSITFGARSTASATNPGP